MANEKMREYWSTTGAVGWVRHRGVFDGELSAFADAVLSALGPEAGERLLDIGCGTGTLLELSGERGATGVGVDISPMMIDAATERVPGATFRVADAQTDDLRVDGPFDAAMSRFGVMFFDDPVAAFANIRRALRPGGRLVFCCWRSGAENLMFTLGTSVLLDAIEPRPEPPRDGDPGPLAFADPDRVRQVLGDAGWSDVAVEPYDAMCTYDTDGGDGVEGRLTMITSTSSGVRARESLEASGRAGEWEGLLDAVRADLREHVVDGRLQFNGATWLVTATNPG